MQRTRTELKGFFKKGAIPTEANFGDLFDSVLVQQDDALLKPGNDPLTLRAIGPEERVLHFSRLDQNLDRVAWQFLLKSAKAAKPGLSIGETTATRLFLESGSGNVGIGTEQPEVSLHLIGPAKFERSDSPAPTLELKSGDKAVTAGGWFEALRLSRAEHSAITHPGGGLLFGLHGNRNFYFADIFGGFQKYVMMINAAAGKVAIGNVDPKGTLDVKGTLVVSNGNSAAVKSGNMASGSMTVGSTDTNYGGGNGWSANTAGLLLETLASTEIAVHDSNTRLASLMYYEGDATNRITIGRDMGWGTIAGVAFGGAIIPKAGNADTAGIMWPRDPGGGSGDAAWIRYYARSGEATTFEIGTSNDGDDHIALMASGNVGIGINAPQYKLDVRGSIGAGNSDIYFTEINHNHTGWGNAAGYAAIENTTSHGALMILGRNTGTPTAVHRVVKLWDELTVYGPLYVNARIIQYAVASDADAKTVLGPAPNGTLIIGGPWDKWLYFYFKTHDGRQLRVRLEGSAW